MRFTTICAVSLVGALSACVDDPTTTVAPIQPSAAVATAADPLSKINRLSPSLENKVQLFKADLVSNGYAIERGYWTLWSANDCKYPLQSMGFCYGNNPTAPYALAVVPQWRDEYSDQSTNHVLSTFQRNMNAIYRLDAREALVVAAELPPPGRYMGIQSNVFSRETEPNTEDFVYKQPVLDDLMRGILFSAMPDPSRMMVIASIGNSTNNVVMTQQTGQPWQAGQQRFFVITPDADVADSVKAALLRAGVPSANDIFVEKVSPDLVRVGLGKSADDMITYIRYALPNDIAAGNEWRANLPLTVFRVRDMSSVRPANPFPIEEYDARNWNFDETALADDINSLVGAVRSYWNQPAAPRFQSFSLFTVFDLVGQHCLGYPNPARGPMNCLGDTQDSDYQISRSFSLDSGQVIAVLGTLATQTGNATYTSLSVNWFPQLVGIRNIDDNVLDGTAARFASALDNDASLFYVYYVARDCSGLENCAQVSRQSVPVGDLIKIIQRNYVTPGFARGPDPSKLLNPVEIVLNGANRPAALLRKFR
jgi:hypothetical protein